MKKVIIVDNYDSFSFNLLHAIEQILEQKIEIVKNDVTSLNYLKKFDYLILSPGPGLPGQAGITLEAIRSLYSSKKIFGVCLGFQAIVEAFNGKLVNLNTVVHGMQTEVKVLKNDSKIFKGIPSKFLAGRYHSWIADDDKTPSQLIVTAKDTEGTIMAIEHQDHHLYGVQFHPESILTPRGNNILANFLNID